MASSKPELPVGIEIDDVRKADVLLRGFETFAINQANIETFAQANALARELRHHELTVQERSDKSDALFRALGAIYDLVPEGQGPVFHQAFQQYHDLTLVFPNEHTEFHTRQFHPNPDAAQPGKANFIASILRAAPNGPGVAVDASQVAVLTAKAVERGKVEAPLAQALVAANEAAEALNAPYYLGSDMMARAMHGSADLLRSKNLDGVADTEAMATWHEQMAAWDREVRPEQTKVLDAALADIRTLLPSDTTEAYVNDFMRHYGLQYRANTEHPEQMEYLPAQDSRRQPGAFLPKDVAKAGRETSILPR